MVVLWELYEAVESRFVGKKLHCGGSMLCMWESCLLFRNICLIPRTKFGSNTMLNILAT